MSRTTDNLDIYDLLYKFNLEKKEADIYLLLIKKKLLSALEISRELKLPRTQTYRLIEKLISNGWINERVEDYGKKFEANSYKQFESIIAEKEETLEELKESMPVVFDKLALLESQSEINKTKVLYYKGEEGLKQVTWNSLKAKDELLIFEIKNMTAFIEKGFAEKIRHEFLRRKVHVKELTNQSKIYGYTKATELMKTYWEPRYIDPKDLEVKLEFLVYNDVYTVYNYRKNEMFCVEIYNKQLAEMQRQIFYYMWNNAKKMKKINYEGDAEVIE